MSITSDEVNYLVYRYLLESGFTHTSFAFQYETAIHMAEIKQGSVSPGALITLLQKGLLFSQVETHLNEDGSEKKCVAPYTLLGPHVCQIQEKKKKKKRKEEKEKTEEKQNKNIEISSTNVIALKEHESDVFVCSWNSVYPLLATGSADGSARIWNIPEDPSLKVTSIILPHSNSSAESKDITTLEWSPDGNLLATGSYDGFARIWHKSGELKFVMERHVGPIFSLKWNKKGELLLSGGLDTSAIVWDIRTGDSRQQFSFHTGPTLDVDWRDDITFATSSADKKIFVCQLGSLEPLKRFSGHTDEVNCIRWDPRGKYLASCADDRTAKVWSLDQDDPIWDLTAHDKEIYTVRWCPAKPNEDKLWLATASFDGAIRLWDINSGNCLYTLSQHKEAVYSVSFTPDSTFLASGSVDKSVYIWNLKDGSLINSYTGQGGVFELAYSPKGDKLAVCYSDNKLVVLYTNREIETKK
ncbi:hypothetical protein HDV06_000511 [Boothiomyces sp. JEL0866]|nr:hypothetical protein HDV06_000511 [Boothiomyces sp. JEL0866]